MSHLFSSDLQRAFKTAEAIRVAQNKVVDKDPPIATETKKLTVLREQNFGYLEGRTFSEKARDSNKSAREALFEAHKDDPGFVDVESKDAMRARSNEFVKEHLTPLLKDAQSSHAVVVVAHGLILIHLWHTILRRFPASHVSIAPDAVETDRDLTLERLVGWSNTGYLELDIIPSATSLLVVGSAQPANVVALPKATLNDTPAESNPASDVASKESTLDTTPRALKPYETIKELDLLLVVKAVNCVEHLKGLKKTRGGIGSSKHDEAQKSIETFFKKRKVG